MKWKTLTLGALGLFAVLVVAVTLNSDQARAAPGDTIADHVFAQGGSFTSRLCNNGGVSASSLCTSSGLALDSAGHLYTREGNANARALEYASPLSSQVATLVFGQPNFTSNTCNNGGVSASSLCGPAGVAVDTAGHLYVADGANNRVLEYDSPLTSQVANHVFGQGGSLTTNTCNSGGVSASSLCNVPGVAVDGAGRLYIGDYGNSRVLEYDNPLTSQVATRVFGQGGSFLSNTCNNGGRSASSLCNPEGVRVDSAGHLYIADKLNHRVLEYSNPLTSQTANVVFGQPNFVSGTANNGGVTACSLGFPEDIAVDAAGNVYISDYFNNRILEYDNPMAGGTCTPPPPPVGGIAELPDARKFAPLAVEDSSGLGAGAIAGIAAGAAAAAIVTLCGTALFVRRRLTR